MLDALVINGGGFLNWGVPLQGPVGSLEDTLFQSCSLFASVARVVSGAASGVGGGLLALWFATGQGESIIDLQVMDCLICCGRSK